MTTVSVIIPSYNRAALIPYTLRSVQQAIVGLEAEIIVVDDHSADHSVELIHRDFPAVQVVALGENRGAPFCRNTGIRIAKGEYVLLLDSDDLIEPDYFAGKLTCFQQNPDTIAVYGPWDHFHSAGEFAASALIPRHSYYPIENTPERASQLERLLGGWFIHPAAILWRKYFLEQLGGQDEQLLINQDVDLLFRALLAGGLITGVASGRALIRDHAGERVGKINENPEKLRQILHLRQQYMQQLQERGLWDLRLAEASARYAFGFWVGYRHQFPRLAEDFYQFARQLNPGINVRGGKLFELSGKVLGPKGAIRLKSLLQRGRL